MAITIRQNLVPSNKYSIKAPYSMTPTHITVHNTANNASAWNEIAYMISNNNEVSYHFAVDHVEAVQGLPLNRNGWHAGDGGSGTGNRQSIGIEICYSLSGGTNFTNAEKNAAKLVAKLMKDHNISLSNVKTHQSWSGKYCPHRTLDLGWQRFLNMVQAETNTNNTPGTYTVQAGDTLYAISIKFGVTVAQLQSWNNLGTSTTILVGQVLKVSAATTYTVKSGDTLYAISVKFGVTVAQLQSWNNLGTSTTILVGQVLKVSP